MDGDTFGFVLARASELRSMINDCIIRNGAVDDFGGRTTSVEGEEEDEEEEEAEGLVGIRDAFTSLERQLAALQALQHQQMYERESSLAQIERGRMILLSKLKEYKGDSLEVIQEAAVFAGETIDHDDALLLPPYQNHHPDFFVLDDLHPVSQHASKYKPSQNMTMVNSKHENKIAEEEETGNSRNTSRGIRHFFGFFAKSVITFVSIVSILTVAGYQPTLKKWPSQFNGINTKLLFCRPASPDGRVSNEEESSNAQCPPGKVLIIEDGKARCLVKERIEVPFESDVTAPHIGYGFG